MKTDDEIYEQFLIKNNFDEINAVYKIAITNTYEYKAYYINIRIQESLLLVFKPFLDWANKVIQK
jgi:hypothetical protein